MSGLPVENGQDYPRPPALEPVLQRVQIFLGGTEIVSTTNALRVSETHHAPTYYIPRGTDRPRTGDEPLRMEGRGALLDPVGRGRRGQALRLELSETDPRVRGVAGSSGHLCACNGRMSRRRRNRGAAAGRFLRRLDHAEPARHGQGRVRNPGLVAGIRRSGSTRRRSPRALPRRGEPHRAAGRRPDRPRPARSDRLASRMFPHARQKRQTRSRHANAA